MTLLILEDNIDIRNIIIETVRHKSNSDHIIEAGTIKEALTLSKLHDITVFIVDLNLPDGSGHDFIRQIRAMEAYKLSWVVIVTGTDETVEQVLDAYNTGRCQIYIKKPFSIAYLSEVLEGLKCYKVVESLNCSKLKIRRKSVDYFFNHDEIIYLETVDKTAYIYTKDKKMSIGRVTLSDLEDRLPNERFLRVHRSYIINKDYIDSILKSNNQSQIKIKHYGHTIPIGRTYKDIQDLI